VPTLPAFLPPQPWLSQGATHAVLRALAAEGATVRFVGGAVRDALLGRPVEDIDLASTAPPETNLRLLRQAGLTAIPTGLKHGTVTAVVEGRHFEITTLRADVETFGRHARVAFTEDWEGDAARRDFTMNALYADADGRLHDPTGGLADLRAGRVRFVGDPATRIAEDRLRALRFFRFLASYGRTPVDRRALAACRDAAPQLNELSGERIRNELFRLLVAPRALPVLRLMQKHGILAEILPAVPDFRRLTRLRRAEAGGPDALRRLAALLADHVGLARDLASRLHLSREQHERLALLVAPPVAMARDADKSELRRIAYRLGVPATVDLALLLGRRRLADRARALTLPRFPLGGRDALALGALPGPQVGRALSAVEDWWVGRDFAPDRGACLEQLALRLR